MKKEVVKIKEFRNVTRFLSLINSKNGSKVLEYLLNQEEPKNVTQIFIGCRMEQSLVSQSLANMRRLNLVTTERKGKQVYYTFNFEMYEQVISCFGIANKCFFEKILQPIKIVSIEAA